MERIGRYEIIRELGRGGFGRVYLANDPLMKSEVAIKVMSNADDPGMLARFRDEAAAARKLRHESIVTIYDVGEEQGVPYIVMEHLQGMDLQKVRDQNVQLSLVEKVRILSRVAAGLQVAHENGIIHRDVKPANIMLLNDGTVKIMDFGIARFNREGATHHTRTGFVVGTLQYIPPEQFEGHPVDTMADLWAFGVIAFQMFSGRNPFEAAETMQVIYNITSLQIPDLHQLNPELPEDLCQVVRKLLMRDRSARYQTFEDVRVDLNPVLEGLDAREANRLVDDARVKAARGDLQSAHQIVRQVLERHPSNTQAKQIRDQIITQIRAGEVTKQVEELLRKGDRDFSAGSYEGAMSSYRQACRLSPGSSTARMRMERAQKMVERAHRILEEMNEARARLAAGDAKEAQRILAGVLADNPDNAEAPGLMIAAQQERGRQEDAARADAILHCRYLVTQQQFAQAIEVLVACARQDGDHADLQRAMEEVRRAETAAAAQARIEGLIAKASDQVHRGEYEAASLILAPLAAEFPANVDIKDLVKFVAQEEARARRMTGQQASLEKLAGSGMMPALPSEPAKPESARVIERALEMSRERERCGQVSDAVHVLDVALSRYPGAAELMRERLRLVAPRPDPLEGAPGQSPDSQADVGRTLVPNPPAPAPRNRRILWTGVGAAGVFLCAGLAYWQFGNPSRPGPPNNPPAPRPAARQLTATQSAEPVRPSSTPAPVAPEAAAPVESPARESGPALASLLPSNVTFVYRKGDPSSERVLKVERSPLQAVVMRAGTWLAASASAGRVVLDLKVAAAASLPPGTYQETVQVTSNRERALLHIGLSVEAERAAVKADVAPPPATPAQPLQNAEGPRALVADAVPPVEKPYSGPKRGTASWSGLLAAGARLILGESGVLEGGGTLTGDDIPPTDVQVVITFPQGIEIQTLPPTSAQRVVITNSTGGPVRQIRINWSKK